MLNNDGIGSEGKLRVIASNGDSFKKVLDVNVVGSFFDVKYFSNWYDNSFRRQYLHIQSI
ncbi:hypothetical protein Godav_020215 [Gossypium davidsonii]|uniref:Uncharacterized protein n=1 Tax=Gossypium davidsonii TaxID=34287 RepID=A0A7J8R3J1_GOSDV|nr:hypothetical protein [Gossypium davidsonii]MBA0607957.1 hypothetical protein [Gossypium davidsonii]